MKSSAKRVDDEIHRLFKIYAAGRRINILDIPKIFEAGQDAYALGESIEHAVKQAIIRYSQEAN